MKGVSSKPDVNWALLPDSAKWVFAVNGVHYWSEKRPRLVRESKRRANWHIGGGLLGTCSKRQIKTPYSGCWTQSLVRRKGGVV